MVDPFSLPISNPLSSKLDRDASLPRPEGAIQPETMNMEVCELPCEAGAEDLRGMYGVPVGAARYSELAGTFRSSWRRGTGPISETLSEYSSTARGTSTTTISS